MATQKQKAPSFVSPKGIFRYPALTKPDFGTKEYPKVNGEYKVSLILTEEEAQPLIEKLQPLHDAAVSEGEAKFQELKVEQRKKLKELTVTDMYTVEYDKVTEEPTGNLIFKFSTSASGKSAKDGSSWTRKAPTLFDSKGKPLTTVSAVWGGTVGKVSFDVGSYFIGGTGVAGLKLYLTAAQILTLVSGGNQNAESFGFGEEDGYEATEEETFPTETTQATDGNSEDF